ncbi:glycosyltransferase family 4 protein [Microcoleus sp. FACHB-672]|uniref:glycosyltransferase family 4 protein n=1 Tax=Microcoleus sp. FACHB-672 TaxID=2692825 RepID=UPI001688746B|nr:glycosyltransferase family 4 protein [Microcoleus sp. FACHB-672]MBD2040288.1 glycosyltransferase family 4 protein [Microcoleus sp. FACHB-672]
MKVCLLSYSDGRGGGYAAAYRLHQGLLQANVDSTMLVGYKTRDDITVLSKETKLAQARAKILPSLDALAIKLLYPKRVPTVYSLQWVPDTLSSRVAQLKSDILNLHWVYGGFLQIESVAKFNQPIVWTLHDMWAFTGGCHYNQECNRYTKSCGACPQLGSHQDKDLSHWVWQRKAKAWRDLNLTIVTPSHWLAQCTHSSSLFKNARIEVIPNGLDSWQYKPVDQRLARERLNLPQDKHLVLFGALNAASDPRKGFHLLQPALRNLTQSGCCEGIELVIFGASQPSHPADLGFKCHYLGKLNDDISLALVYAAADVFVAPSTQDNLPNTVMEALACGTPCVAFKIGGMPDMIEHQQNGYLARPFEVDDLAKGILWVLEDKDRWIKLGNRAREKAELEFTQELQASRYLSLFTEIVSKYRKEKAKLS